MHVFTPHNYLLAFRPPGGRAVPRAPTPDACRATGHFWQLSCTARRGYPQLDQEGTPVQALVPVLYCSMMVVAVESVQCALVLRLTEPMTPWKVLM
jgi:hypothetical protein